MPLVPVYGQRHVNARGVAIERELLPGGRALPARLDAQGDQGRAVFDVLELRAAELSDLFAPGGDVVAPGIARIFHDAQDTGRAAQRFHVVDFIVEPRQVPLRRIELQPPTRVLQPGFCDLQRRF